MTTGFVFQHFYLALQLGNRGIGDRGAAEMIRSVVVRIGAADEGSGVDRRRLDIEEAGNRKPVTRAMRAGMALVECRATFQSGGRGRYGVCAA